MHIIIESDEFLTIEKLDKIKDIFKNSKCPNESLINTFGEEVSFDGERVCFGSGENFCEYIEV